MIRCDVLFTWHCTVQYLLHRKHFSRATCVKTIHVIQLMRVMSASKTAHEHPERERERERDMLPFMTHEMVCEK